MSLALWRIVQDPLSSWRALRLRRREAGGHLPFDAAWRQARMLVAPDEMHTPHPLPRVGTAEKWTSGEA
jgi:hypothetical protein